MAVASISSRFVSSEDLVIFAALRASLLSLHALSHHHLPHGHLCRQVMRNLVGIGGSYCGNNRSRCSTVLQAHLCLIERWL